jgi:DtxR family Mn-dependent transcriptional regulator
MGAHYNGVMPTPGEHHPAFEEYCECIFELHEDNLEVIQARIADRLQVSRPSVSEMIKRMSEEGLVVVSGGHISLTATGEELGQRVVRRHRLAERFMTDILGLSWALAHREAGRWEHVMSIEVEEAMSERLGNPTTCPHGNPIPGSGYTAPDAIPLIELTSGQTFTVSRIPEELEFSPGMLEFLEETHLMPGMTGTVASTLDTGTMTIDINGAHIEVDSFATERILVTV